MPEQRSMLRTFANSLKATFVFSALFLLVGRTFADSKYLIQSVKDPNKYEILGGGGTGEWVVAITNHNCENCFREVIESYTHVQNKFGKDLRPAIIIISPLWRHAENRAKPFFRAYGSLSESVFHDPGGRFSKRLNLDSDPMFFLLTGDLKLRRSFKSTNEFKSYFAVRKTQ